MPGGVDFAHKMRKLVHGRNKRFYLALRLLAFGGIVEHQRITLFANLRLGRVVVKNRERLHGVIVDIRL